MRRPARLIVVFARRAISTTTVSAWRSPDEGAPTRSFNWKAAGAGCRWVKSNCGLAKTSWRRGSAECEQILLADQFRVRGLSVRNREAGVGTPLMAVWPTDPDLGMRRTVPATASAAAARDLWPTSPQAGAPPRWNSILPSKTPTSRSARAKVPLETDLTTYRAYTLSQSTIWKLGKLDFLAPAERIPSQLILNQPYEPDRIPVVFVHGTFSSPVTWAEMANSLTADPVLRQRYQIWSFIYGSGNPLRAIHCGAARGADGRGATA